MTPRVFVRVIRPDLSRPEIKMKLYDANKKELLVEKKTDFVVECFIQNKPQDSQVMI